MVRLGYVNPDEALVDRGWHVWVRDDSFDVVWEHLPSEVSSR